MKNRIPVLLLSLMLLAMCGCSTSTETTDTSQSPDLSTQEETMEEVVLDSVHMSATNMRPLLVDDRGIKLSVIEFSYANSETVFKINFLLENNTTKDISVVLTDVVVEGYDISTSHGKTFVEAGHKARCDSSVWQKNLDEVGITEWTTIEGVVEVREDYYGDPLYTIPVTIEKECWTNEESYSSTNPIPQIESTDVITIPKDAIILKQDNLYPTIIDENGIVLSIHSYGYANGKTVFKTNFMLENNTDKELGVVLTDVVVDGFDISTSQGNVVVDPGHKAMCDSSVWQRELEAVGISNWIVFTGNIEVREGWFGDALYQIPVVVYKEVWEAAN